jgi:pyruvate/oxaloacetate carboxyltransferase
MDILSLVTLKNGVDMTFEMKDGILSFKMDQPEDKDMMVTIHAIPYDTDAIIHKTEGIQSTFHQSTLEKKYMLRPGTYRFTFSNDPSVHLSVVFINNKLSFEVY